MKELRFHPQFQCLMATTAEDSFNVFRPNLEPVDTTQPSTAVTNTNDENMSMSVASGAEETKQDTSSSAANEESKR